MSSDALGVRKWAAIVPDIRGVRQIWVGRTWIIFQDKKINLVTICMSWRSSCTLRYSVPDAKSLSHAASFRLCDLCPAGLQN